MVISAHVSIKQLKSFARTQLRECPVVREMIREEPDRMPAEEFVVKSRVWLQVLNKEIRAKESRGIRHLENRLVVR